MDNKIVEVVADTKVEENDDTSLSAGQKLDGVVIGVIMGFSDIGKPLVAFPGNQSKTGIAAHSTTIFEYGDVGCQVALLFESSDPQRPVIIGRIQHPEEIVQYGQQNKVAELDGERLEFKAGKEIVLRCGKASITLTKAGKIILRGAYVLSRSSGVNRIKGGSVQIN